MSGAAITMADLDLARRVVERYCDSVAPVDLTRILMADPRRVLELAVEALGELPGTSDAIDADLEASRARIRTDGTWWRDERAQLRRIVLLRSREDLRTGGKQGSHGQSETA